MPLVPSQYSSSPGTTAALVNRKLRSRSSSSTSVPMVRRKGSRASASRRLSGVTAWPAGGGDGIGTKLPRGSSCHPVAVRMYTPRNASSRSNARFRTPPGTGYASKVRSTGRYWMTDVGVPSHTASSAGSARATVTGSRG
jgi:hypothetical protein